MEARAFKWSCFALAAIVAGALLWMLNDMRLEVKRTNDEVVGRLPQILDNVQKGTDTLARVSRDIDALRDLLGISSVARDRSLVVYADSVLDHLEAQTGQIGLTKTLGKGLKDLEPVQEWVRSARKEAVWQTLRASSKREILERLCQNKFGSDWMFAPATGEPIKLIDHLRATHPDSKAM